MPVTVDTSPPIVSGVWIGEQTDHSVTSLYNLTINWDPIVDPESGLANIEWAIGGMRHMYHIAGMFGGENVW